MDLLHSHERFHLAFRGLAVSSAPLTQRIAEVFAAYLADLDADELPPNVGARFCEYQESWRAHKSWRSEEYVQHFGLIQTWVRDLSWKKAREVARWIVDAHDEIDSLLCDELSRAR